MSREILKTCTCLDMYKRHIYRKYTFTEKTHLQKIHVHVKRNSENTTYVKRYPIERPTQTLVSTMYVHRKRRVYIKRDLCMSKEILQGDLCISKETYACPKRHVYIKRDVCISKETYICRKRS